MYTLPAAEVETEKQVVLHDIDEIALGSRANEVKTPTSQIRSLHLLQI